MHAYQGLLVVGFVMAALGGVQAVRLSVDGQGAGAGLTLFGFGGAALIAAHLMSPHGVSLSEIVTAFAALTGEVKTLAR